MHDARMRYVTESEVARVLTPAEAFTAVEASLLRLARGEVESRPRERLPLPDGVFAVMPCVDRGLGYAGLKTYVWTPDCAPFLIVLFTVSGEPVAVLEAAHLGELRTAAASAVAATRLASESPATLGVVGCGRQAASHVRAMRRALPTLDRVIVHAPNAERLVAFCHVHDAEPGTPDEVAACDVVVTATTARTPVLHRAFCARARSSARSARTIRRIASSTMRSSSGRRSFAPTPSPRRRRRQAI